VPRRGVSAVGVPGASGAGELADGALSGDPVDVTLAEVVAS